MTNNKTFGLALSNIGTEFESPNTYIQGHVSVEDLNTNQVAAFIEYCKRRGVFMNILDYDGQTISYEATNATKPIENIHGIWFKAWSEKMEDTRARASETLDEDFPEHPNLKKLRGINFNPAVWIGPDHEGTFFTPDAKQVLLSDEATRLILDIERACSEEYVRPGILGEYVIPGSLVLLGNSLTIEHIEAISEGIRKVPAEHREIVMAHLMRTLAGSKKHEELTPDLFAQMLDALAEILDSKYKRDTRLTSLKLLFKTGGDFLTPEHVRSIGSAHEDTFQGLYGMTYYLKDHMSDLDIFSDCAQQFADMYAKEHPVKFEHIHSDNLIPDFVAAVVNNEKKPAGADVPAIMKRVVACIDSMPDRFGENASHLLNVLIKYLSTIIDAKNPISIEDFETFFDELEDLSRQLGEGYDRVLTNDFSEIVRFNGGNLRLEDLAKYKSILLAERAKAETPEEFLPNQKRLWWIIYNTGDLMTPEMYQEYLDLIRPMSPAAYRMLHKSIQSAKGKWSNKEQDNQSDLNSTSIQPMVGISERLAVQGERLRTEALKGCIHPIVGSLTGNDAKTTAKAASLYKEFCVFVEGNIDKIISLENQHIAIGAEEDFGVTHKLSDAIVEAYAKAGGRGGSISFPGN